MQTKSLIFIFALLGLAACRQSVLAPNNFLEADVSGGVTYLATLYYGESKEDSCFLDDGETGVGILFEYYNFTNVCLGYKDDVDIYLIGYVESKKYYLVHVGNEQASAQVQYKPLTSREVKFQLGKNQTAGMTAEMTENIDCMFLISVAQAKDAYGSSYPIDNNWNINLHGVDEYTISVEVSKGETECITPTMGRLSGLTICLEFQASKDLLITVDEHVIGLYTDKDGIGSKITFLFQNLNDFVYVTKAGSTQALFYVTSSQVLWCVTEGDLPAIEGNLNYTMSLQNADQTEKGYYFSCINTFNGASLNTILYQEVQIICGQCIQEDNYCQIKIYLRDGHIQTYSTFEYLADWSLDIMYSSVFEVVTISHGPISYLLFADEFLIYALEGKNGFSYLPIVGDINFITESSSTIKYEPVLIAQASFVQGLVLEEKGGEVVMDLYCNFDACYLGLLDGYTFNVAKIYKGSYDEVRLTYINGDANEQTCLSLVSEDGYTLNDCGVYSQWEMYYKTFLLSPYMVFELTEDDIAVMGEAETEEESQK